MTHDLLDETWPYSAYDPCPCGSGRKAKFCCRAGKNRWVTKPAWIPMTGRPPPSGFDHPSCMAAGSGRCSQKLSGEHYIPESVLRLLAPTMALSGMVFPEKEIPTGKLKANILCKAHNERLSPLDSAMKTLIENLRAHVRGVTKGPPRGTLLLLNGDDIECALLKMLCGLAASGAVKGLPRDSDPRWIPILYGEKPWPEGWGLYVQQASGGTQNANFDGMSLGFNLAEGGRAHQLGVRFGPWHLVLHVAADDVDAPSPAGFAYRPDLLVAQRGSAASAVHLTYSRPSSGGFVRTTIHS